VHCQAFHIVNQKDLKQTQDQREASACNPGTLGVAHPISAPHCVFST